MRIKFLPQLEINEVTHVLSGTTWRYGEVKDIPDDAVIRVKAGRTNDYCYVRTCEDLLSNPAFVLAEDNLNPQYTCHGCGITTLLDGHCNPLDASTVLYADDEGQRLCVDCFFKTRTTLIED